MRVEVEVDVENVSTASDTLVELAHATLEIVRELVDLRSALVELLVGSAVFGAVRVRLRLFLLLDLFVVHVVGSGDEVLRVGFRVLHRGETG